MAHSKRKIQICENDATLVLSFPYDPVLVRLVREVPGRVFDGDSKTWSIPKTSRSMRTLLTLMRVHHVSGHETIERINRLSLPRPTELWWSSDASEAS